MTKPIPFAFPDITAKEIASVVKTLESGWLTTGPRTGQFEKAFAKAVGAGHAVALSSCTAALHLALEAVGVGPGDEVVLPTLTFASASAVVLHLGARPVLADILADDHNVDPESVQKAITPRTKAVLPVHFAGQPCRMDKLKELAGQHNLFLVDDAAHALPAAYQGDPVGSVGDITCFSFYATKTVTSGEGGMATTDNPAWAARIRMMSLHGMSKDAWKRYTAEGSWFYEVEAPGFKCNMSDLMASLGLVQLDRAKEMLAKRRRIAQAYQDAFRSEETIELLGSTPNTEHAWHLFVIKLRESALRIGRDEWIRRLKESGIGTSVHFIPIHLHPYYRKSFGYRPEDFPTAHDCYRRSISLPIYSRMTDAEVQRVIEAVLDLARRYRR